ncbi:MAG: hypothetical protein IJ341_02870 [Bacteroidales bacterium]|nr:hypothetical protein [Bacteroidales bacterium]
MKSVLLVASPENCALMANGKKTIDVKKSKPKVDTPFKGYIYCTKDKKIKFWTGKRYSYSDDHSHNLFDRCGNGKVIGEFICDKIYQYTTMNFKEGVDISDEDMERMSCLSLEELSRYESGAVNDFCLSYYGLFGWHITELIIYVQPKALTQFFKPCKHSFDIDRCGKCKNLSYNDLGIECCDRRIIRPPQSWCYVESLR